MSKKNALPLIEKALEEKSVEVVLPGGSKLTRGYLIKISGDMDPFQDFLPTYKGVSASAFEKTIERLYLEKPESLQNHGVLIDSETLKIIFTFNMAFVDLHKERKRLVRFPPVEIFPVEIPDYYGKPCRDGDPCFGGKAKRLVEKYGYFPRGKVVNCLPSFTESLRKHTVPVRLPGEKALQELHLIKIWAKTRFEEDYKIAFPDSKQNRVFFRTVGEFREYGLFIRPKDLQFVFAFNTEFASYDSQSKTVKYSTLAENIVERIPHELVGPQHYRLSDRWGMDVAIMYALVVPRK